jgi:hypothetical protein
LAERTVRAYRNAKSLPQSIAIAIRTIRANSTLLAAHYRPVGRRARGRPKSKRHRAPRDGKPTAALIDLSDAVALDDLGPFRNFGLHEGLEFRLRHRERNGALFGPLLLDVGA